MSDPIAAALAPLFDALSPDVAMQRLVPDEPADPKLTALVERAITDPALAGRPELEAGLWLYVDELDRSHRVSQGIKTPTGSFWHGIMHRREGEFGNSHYWMHLTGLHPAMATITGYDPHGFIDEVSARHRENPAHLVELQREEWKSLFAWCCAP
jgi:hypothetical protein